MNLELFTPRPHGPGFLVTIDGPNGSGKTSIAAAAADYLRKQGTIVHTTRQPSPTPLGERIRAAELDMHGRAFACLIAADRQQQAEVEVSPKLDDGVVVLCDRYVESSLVLQRLDGVELDYILAINSGIPRPDLRIRLVASADVLRARIAGRHPGTERRFERTASPEEELALYADADDLLATHYDIPAIVYDTSATKSPELGAAAARLILERFGTSK